MQGTKSYDQVEDTKMCSLVVLSEQLVNIAI